MILVSLCLFFLDPPESKAYKNETRPNINQSLQKWKKVYKSSTSLL